MTSTFVRLVGSSSTGGGRWGALGAVVAGGTQVAPGLVGRVGAGCPTLTVVAGLTLGVGGGQTSCRAIHAGVTWGTVGRHPQTCYIAITTGRTVNAYDKEQKALI